MIHLAGESIGDARWTEEKKKRLYESRVKLTGKLVEAVNKAKTIKIFAGASAVGFYGNRQDEELTESSSLGEGFLADLCKDWELAYTKLDPSIRQTIFRIGVVLDQQGGHVRKAHPYLSKVSGWQGRQRQTVDQLDSLTRPVRLIFKSCRR